MSQALMLAEQKLRDVVNHVVTNELPGSLELVERTKDVGDWIDKQRGRIEQAIRDDDDSLLDRGLGAYVKAWERVNELLAEEYRLKYTDPARWELRYVKWMKLQYLRFACELGDFYLVPRPPVRKPKAKHWFTVDEVLAMFEHQVTIDMVHVFASLPIRPESLIKPASGETDWHITINSSGATVRAIRG